MSWTNRGGSGLAHNPPFVVPVQIDQRLQDFIPLITGYLLDVVVSTARQNQARAVFQQLLESQEGQAPLGEMAQSLASLTEFYVFAENIPENRVEYLLKDKAQVVVNAYLAHAVNAYPNEFAPLLNQDQVNDVQAYIHALETELGEAARFFQGGGARGGFAGRGGGYGAQNNQRGWQPNQGGRGYSRGGGGGNYGGGSRWDEDNVQGGYANGHQDNWPGARMASRGGGFSGRGGTGKSVWDDAPAPRRGGAPTDSSFNSSGGGRVRREFDQPKREEPVQEVRRNVQPIVANQTVVDGITFLPPNANHEWPKVVDVKRPWDWILLEDGTQFRPAYKSDWTVSYDKDTPYTPWYDPETHILFHVKRPSNGAVTQEPFEREESMNYLDHELDASLRRKGEDAARARDNVVKPAWEMVESLKPNPASPLATAEPLSDDDGEMAVQPVNPDQYLVATSLSDAVKRACLKIKLDRPEILKQAFELYVDRCVLTTHVEVDFEDLFQLTNAQSFRELFQHLIDAEHSDLVADINQRVTESLNRALKQNMGMKNWSIDSFMEDFADLMIALKEEYGASTVTTLENYALEIIPRALAHYRPKDIDENVRKVVGIDEDVSPVIWIERSSVTRLPVSSAELRVPGEHGVLVTPEIFPEIHKTLNAVFERTADLPHTFHGRYVATNDGAVYSIVKGYLNDQAILIFKADFTLS